MIFVPSVSQIPLIWNQVDWEDPLSIDF